MLRTTSILIGVALFVSAPLISTGQPVLVDPQMDARVDWAVVNARTGKELSFFAGSVEERCGPATETTKLCEWALRGGNTGWKELANAIGTRDKINLICELPNDGGERTQGSCGAYPKRSNRNEWIVPSETGKGRGANKQRYRSKLRQRYQVVANRALDSATTLAAMSRLMGAIPDECDDFQPGEQLCLWRTTAHTPGHGTLVMAIDAAKTKNVRLRCIFPTTGEPRKPDSCHAEIGA